MEAGSVISVDSTILASSVVEALAVGTLLSATNYFSRLLSVKIGSVLGEGNWPPRMSTTEERFPFDELHGTKQEALKNEDAIETDEDDEEEENDANDDDNDEDDEDFSGEEEGEEGDPEENLGANREGGSDEEDDNEEDDDDEGEDDDEEEDDEEDEEDVPQPPTKKRK